MCVCVCLGHACIIKNTEGCRAFETVQTSRRRDDAEAAGQRAAPEDVVDADDVLFVGRLAVT